MVLPWICSLALSFSLFFSQSAFAQADKITFPKEKIQIGKKTVEVEVARTNAQHEHGLMYRDKLPTDSGMLFVFPNEEIRYFWMKNTFIDLSIGYFDKDRKLIDIQEMKASTSIMAERPATYPSQGPAQYALEMNKAWFAKNNIKPGVQFKFVEKQPAKK